MTRVSPLVKKRRMALQKFWTIIGCLFLCAFLAACNAPFNHVVNYETQTVRVSDSPQIIVESDAGSITARRGVDGQVNIDMEKHASSQEDINRMFVSITNTDNTVRITYH